MIINLEKRKIKIIDNLIDNLSTYRQDDVKDPEQGGMLIGSMIIDSKDIIVDHATYPMEGDFFNRFRFVRSIRHNRILARIWMDNCQTSMYLGEWHTHPQRNPSPSGQDYDNWKSLAYEANSMSDVFVFVIVGIDNYGVWSVNRKTEDINKIYEGRVSI